MICLLIIISIISADDPNCTAIYRMQRRVYTTVMYHTG